MTTRNLRYLFHPESIAVIGATSRPSSVGATALANLRGGGFGGPVHAVNPRHSRLGDYPCYPDVASLPSCPDLALICTPARTVPGIIAELGARGCRAAIVLSAGLGSEAGPGGAALQQQMLEAARPHLLRILGPNCVGMIAPGLGLNASFANAMALPGTLAFASQSGALSTAVLDWSRSHGIGFSYFISLGDSADVDLADVLDYLDQDAGTSAILLYVESVRDGRKFMSAARAAARRKPVLIAKAGRSPEAAKAAASHTGALAGVDDVWDAAIRRAGMLRVSTTEELFDAVETLARARPLTGDRLAIVTNGGGAGVMATDALVLNGGRLAELSSTCIGQLGQVLPPTWSHGNPVDIVGDAPVERYLQAIDILQSSPDADALLLLHAPTAIVPSTNIALAVSAATGARSRPLFTGWLGGGAVEGARTICREAGIPTYDTPEQAVRGFLQAVQYRRNQELLMQTPPPFEAATEPDKQQVRRIIEQALASGATMLSEPGAKTVLSAYGVPVAETCVVTDPAGVAEASQAIGFPVVIKIVSPDITHKSDAGGVALNIGSAQQARDSASSMLSRIRASHPDARIHGFSVQRMVTRPGAIELIVGATCDRTFGPVLMFGQGGVAVELLDDRAIALPPLNHLLADDLISRTRIARRLAGYRNHPAADLEALRQALLQVSQLICDWPEIVELDINPLIADEQGVLALDARIGLRRETGRERADPTARLAILPYPKDLEERQVWRGAPLLIRPVRPEDEPLYCAFFDRLTQLDIHLRYLCTFASPSHGQLARMTQIDYARDMSFIALQPWETGSETMLGECQVRTDPDNICAEFALVVRSDCKCQGLGRILMRKLVTYCEARGIQRLVGTTLPDNAGMLRLARQFGFHTDAELGGVALSLELQRSGT